MAQRLPVCHLLNVQCHDTHIPLRSRYSIELSQDLDDAAVSLLIENGLDKRFPVACAAWKLETSESSAIAQKCALEKKKLVDEKLINDKSLLEDTLARELTRGILQAYPCVLLP